MRCEWRTNKVVHVPYAGTVRFMTLWEDKRDVMCDSPRPEWGVADLVANRRVEWVDIMGSVVSVRDVDRDIGNNMYKKIVAVSRPGSGFPPAVLERIFGEVAE